MRMANFCGRIQEAGLLLAVAVSVLYFNLLSSRVFDPDKISLARAIGMIMLAALATAWIESRIDKKSEPSAPG